MQKIIVCLLLAPILFLVHAASAAPKRPATVADFVDEALHPALESIADDVCACETKSCVIGVALGVEIRLYGAGNAWSKKAKKEKRELSADLKLVLADPDGYGRQRVSQELPRRPWWKPLEDRANTCIARLE